MSSRYRNREDLERAVLRIAKSAGYEVDTHVYTSSSGLQPMEIDMVARKGNKILLIETKSQERVGLGEIIPLVSVADVLRKEGKGVVLYIVTDATVDHRVVEKAREKDVRIIDVEQFGREIDRVAPKTMPEPYTFEILPIETIRPHEEVLDVLIQVLVDDIRKAGSVEPIIVDKDSLIILDGAHRYMALKTLDCRKVPVYLVDYASDDISVLFWPTAEVDSVTKEEVIQRGLSGELFPPKTTRHILGFMLKRVQVRLEDLT